MASTTVVVYDGTMINHNVKAGVLGIGAGSFASEKYSDEKGKETRGATAGLWLVIRGRPDTNAFERVHAGQQIDYQGYRITVSAVGSDKRSMYVKMELENAG
ncbi:MAG: hypothetical protein WBM17_02040 [Anaerolineales bacterium]